MRLFCLLWFASMGRAGFAVVVSVLVVTRFIMLLGRVFFFRGFFVSLCSYWEFHHGSFGLISGGGRRWLGSVYAVTGRWLVDLIA
jgi:hypothetical protein